jgi:hypothetical protein
MLHVLEGAQRMRVILLPRPVNSLAEMESLPDLAITETIDEVIVYHPHGLHVRVNHCRTNEAESAML